MWRVGRVRRLRKRYVIETWGRSCLNSVPRVRGIWDVQSRSVFLTSHPVMLIFFFAFVKRFSQIPTKSQQLEGKSWWASFTKTVRDRTRRFVLLFVLKNRLCSTFFDLVEHAKSLILKENSGFVPMFYVFWKRGGDFLRFLWHDVFAAIASPKIKNTKNRPYTLKKRRTSEHSIINIHIFFIFINKINNLHRPTPKNSVP